MLRDRNDTTHIYNEQLAIALVDKVIKDYLPEFEHMGRSIQARYGEELDSIA